MSVWNSSRLLSIPYESEVLLPICYQIFDGVPDKGVEKYFARMGLWRVSDCEELVGGDVRQCCLTFDWLNESRILFVGTVSHLIINNNFYILWFFQISNVVRGILRFSGKYSNEFRYWMMIMSFFSKVIREILEL